MDTSCAICVACCGGSCMCGTMLITGVVYGVFELVLSPVSIPCSLYRRRKYNRWLNEWSETISEDELKTVEEYCAGPLNYAALNKKVKFTKALVTAIKNRNNNEIHDAFATVPMCIIGNTRYPWNFTLSKKDFFKEMDFFIKKITPKSNLQNMQIDANRLKELLMSNVDYTCPICADDDDKLNMANVAVTDCNHVFHEKCLKTWTDASHNNCPECRASLT